MNRLLQKMMITKSAAAAGLFALLLLCGMGTAVFAGGGKKQKPQRQPQKKVSLYEFNDAYFEEKSQFGNPEIDRWRANANASVNEVDAQQRYVDFLSPSDLNRLPIGLKKKVGNTSVKIAISSAVFTKNYAELTVFAKLEIPQNNNSNTGPGGGNPNATANKKTIFFGVKGLKLSKDGGIIGDAKLVLMGDYAIPINGGKNSLILKGGFDINTGQGQDLTYISIDCNGFKELGLKAEVEFPRSMLEPTDQQGNVLPTGVVKGGFSTVVSSWNDIVASVSLTPFEIKGIKGVGFKVDNAVIDLSDKRNNHGDVGVVFPPGYQQKYVGNDATTIPLWRGVYAREIRVTLPKSFGNRDSAGRVAFGAKDLIIDNNGITGLFYAENIIPIHKGKAGGWQFSLDSFRVALEANRLLRAGFGGKIGLPVNKRQDVPLTAADSAAARTKFLAYSAVFGVGGDYVCRVINKDTLNFDIWKAKVRLTPNSYVELAGNQDAFRPSAMLSGDITLKSNTSPSGAERTNSLIDFKGIQFQELHIKTTPPMLSAKYFGVNGSVNLKLGMATLTLDSIRMKSYAVDEMGLAFGVKITLQNDAFKGGSHLAVIGKYSQEEGLASWKYNRIKIDDIYVKAKIGVLDIDGYAQFMDNDPLYGDGFRGKLGIKVDKPKFETQITAIFGNKGFRYWFVDGKVNVPSLAEGNVINISGIVGGAYYQMKKGDVVNRSLEEQLSPFNYVPDSTAGLGIRFGVLFNAFSHRIDEGMAMLEVAFNKHGGMRYIGLFGNIKVMAKLDLTDQLGEVTKQFEKIEEKIKPYTPNVVENKALAKMFGPTAAAKDMFEGIDVSAISGSVTAAIGISYDFNNNVFDASADVNINFGGIFTGRGPGGRAGWMKLHVSPNKWYIHMGSPTDPLGVKLGLGPISLQTYAYFMVGHDIPSFPDIPPALQAMFASQQEPYQNQLSSSKIATEVNTGKGIAFGAGAEFRTGDIKFLILYANFSAGIGFNVMVKEFPNNVICQETGQRPGIGGWRAQGNIYAYFQGEAGVRIKLGPIKKNVPVIKAGAAILLEAELPNPSWFGARTKINVTVLKVIKININLKFSFGQKCTLVAAPNSDGNIDFDEYKVVTNVTPATNAQDVSLYVRPQVSCSTPPNESFNLPDDNPAMPDETYRPQLSSIEFKAGSQVVKASYKITNEGKNFTIYPDSALKPETNYSLVITINYQKLVSGAWVNVTDNGTAVTEVTTTNFRTGKNPPFIAEDNIAYMYPYMNQKFYYKDESTVGRVLLKYNRSDLFGAFTSWKAQYSDAVSGEVLGSTAVTYNAATDLVTYPVLAGLQNNKSYKLEILGVGSLVAGQTVITDPTQPILKFTFKTSQYNTLAQKIGALQTVQPIVGRIQSDVIDLQAEVSNYEGFDINELVPNIYSGEQQTFIEGVSTMDDPYYTSQIEPLIRYQSGFYSYAGISIRRTTEVINALPNNAILPSSYYQNAAGGTSYSPILNNRMPFVHDVNRYFNYDFNDLRNQIVNKYLANTASGPTWAPMYEAYRCGFLNLRWCYRMHWAWVQYFASPSFQQSSNSNGIAAIPSEMRPLVTQPFPFMSAGPYKVNFRVKLAASRNGAYGLNYDTTPTVQYTYQNPIL